MADLIHLPYNKIYKFRISVFDIDHGKWTDFSEPSTEVNMKISKNNFKWSFYDLLIINDKIDLRIELERFDQNSLRIKWNQHGEFTYPISRYFVLVSVNGKNQSYSIDNHLMKSS